MDTAHDNELNQLRRSLLALLPGLALASKSEAQDAAVIMPGAYRVAFENDKLRALEYRGRPGMGVCGSGVHSHPAHLTVGLFDGKVRVRSGPGQPWKIVDGKAGDTFWSEPETHEVENISGRDSHAILIELKTPAKT